MSQADHLSQDN